MPVAYDKWFGLEEWQGARGPELVRGWITPAIPVFRILTLSFPLMALNYALTHQLIGWDRHGAYAAICAGALVFNVALNARLIPALSMAGAAWSTLLTEVVLTAGCLAALWGGANRTAAVPLVAVEGR